MDSSTTARHIYTLQIREYEAGSDGSAQHGHLARFLQAAAFSATRALGWDNSWYAARGTAWVLRGLRIEFVSPARELETLTIQTWLSSIRRVRGFREYTASVDGRSVARAQTDWVYIDRRTMAPARLPQEAVDQTPMDPATVWQLVITAGEPAGLPVSWRHAVEWRELDGLQHVNNAVYLEWFEQAWCEASGQPPSATRAMSIEFVRAARLGDEIVVTSQPASNGVWTQKAVLAGNGQPVAHCLLLPASASEDAN